jgi:hypothetical protein
MKAILDIDKHIVYGENEFILKLDSDNTDIKLTDYIFGNICEQICNMYTEQLTELDLFENKLTSLSMENIGNLILNCPKLKFINLGFNNMGDSGIETLLTYLPSNRVLEINLSQNHISNSGLNKITQALRNLDTIKINLTGNSGTNIKRDENIPNNVEYSSKSNKLFQRSPRHTATPKKLTFGS